MGKEINYNMGKIISEMASKPLRSKQDAILLLLYTIRMFDVDEFLPENEKVRVNISTYDLGYIRYDYDEEHHKELLHPLYHLDVCLDTAATYKIGLKKSITQDEFKDILDITTNCVFLQM